MERQSLLLSWEEGWNSLSPWGDSACSPGMLCLMQRLLSQRDSHLSKETSLGIWTQYFSWESCAGSSESISKYVANICYLVPNPMGGTQGLERAVAGPLWQDCSLQGWALHSLLPNTGEGPSENPKFQLGGTLRRLCARLPALAVQLWLHWA